MKLQRRHCVKKIVMVGIMFSCFTLLGLKTRLTIGADDDVDRDVEYESDRDDLSEQHHHEGVHYKPHKRRQRTRSWLEGIQQRAENRNSAFYNFPMRSENNNSLVDTPYGSGHTVQCQNRSYGDLSGWPKASVIITFCDNELLSDVLHTVHSVLQRSPDSLLHEIILIDDNTQKDDFKSALDNYCRSVFGEKVHLHRSATTLGLIQARLLGSRLATADVIVVLDAHMEVQDKWLEAVLYEIRRDSKIMATISMDWMEPMPNGKWKYKKGPGDFMCYFDWNLKFGYSWPSEEWQDKYNQDPTIILPSPCSVGNWAMDRSFFIEIGELDDGMKMWGGENLDLAIRTWLFGGRAVQVPCSHAAHLERPHQRDYRDNWDQYKHYNYKRLVEVWFDQYKHHFYLEYPQLLDKTFHIGNISSRLEIKKKAKYNFSWYLENVYPSLGVYNLNSLAYGKLHNLEERGCVLYRGGNTQLAYDKCGRLRTELYLSNEGLLRAGAMIVQPEGLKPDKEVSYMEGLAQLGKKHIVRWLHWKGGPIKVVGHNLCLAYDKTANNIRLQVCDPCVRGQRWTWDTYTGEYIASLNITQGQIPPKWVQTLSKEYLQLSPKWLQARVTSSPHATSSPLC